MATNEQLFEYVQRLPPIYKEILATFPRLEPQRKAGYGLAFQTLATDFESRGLEFNLGEIMQACKQLENHNIVQVKNRIFVHPTDYGERLIAAITETQPVAATVPPLPSPPE